MNWKKIGLSLLYPHLVVIICLLPTSIVLLSLSLLYLTPESVLAILSYLFAFYVLLIICLRMPRMIKSFQTFKQKNKFMQKWFNDVHLRMNVSLYGAFIGNIIFAIFQLIWGFYNHSYLFVSMFVYYALLGIMRFFLLKHTSRYNVNEAKQIEIKKYILCGWLLLFMNLALAVVVVFVILLNEKFQHQVIVTIAMATFTFLTFTIAIIDSIRYRKYQSPVYSAAKIINLIAGCVSILTLETTMLATFGSNENELFKVIILALTGLVVIGFAITMALTMIIKGYRKLLNKI